MEFIPYSCQNIDQEDIDAVSAVLKSDYLTQGPTIPLFEQYFADRHEVAHAVAVSNATAGLHIALLALGVGPGSTVWTSPNSFVASANCALYCGADIDFVDIDARTRNMSVDALREKLASGASSRKLPKVVIPIDFAGLPSDLREIRQLADEYGFRILEDASHATGATYLGKPVGSNFADVTVFSFHAVKIITTGEGGMATTNDEVLALRLRQLRTHGITRDPQVMEHPSPGAWYYEQKILGYNYRMTDIQAALGISQLRRLDILRSQREILVNRYNELLAELPLILPVRLSDRESSWHLYVVEVDDESTDKTRGAVFECLRTQKIGANVHYVPIHTQPFYERLGFKMGDFPASERYYNRAISIPLFPALTEAQQIRVVAALQNALHS
ncbi:MAG: UDP-4-amino-4,6-dideoxy-N-acetyl-beta-L-altrosamine transaminase [Pseudomonadota bacterium]|nr:UDP-4-amino-4,6-dideoxy-N-acetyl-beta-L-altrosamine transaminase [Pseudomonadota bacterium]